MRIIYKMKIYISIYIQCMAIELENKQTNKINK